MPNCDNCGDHFPNLMLIDDKQRNLSTRKYCLKCSPFKAHNTRSFKHIKTATIERQCMVCGKPYKGKGLKCNSCSANLRRYKVKDDAVNYLGGKCIRCGYNKCQAALVFHHTNADEKDFVISKAYSHSWKIIKQELDKCVLLCSNCHSEIHWEEQSTNRNLTLERLRIVNENQPKRTIDWPPNEDLILMLQQETRVSVARKIDVALSTLHSHCKEVGIKVPRYKTINWPTDEWLQKAVWERPVSHIAKEIGISDRAIGKRCKKRGIPTPKLGYWSKLKAGKI